MIAAESSHMIRKLIKAGTVHFGYVTLALTGYRLPRVFSRKHQANLPGGFTSFCSCQDRYSRAHFKTLPKQN